MFTDITQRRCAEQGIAQRMQQDVAVGVREQEHRRHFQVQQFVGGGCVHQQVNPFVLTNGQARNREHWLPRIAYWKAR